MKCLFCNNIGEGFFCSLCGKEYIKFDEFSNKNFKATLQYVHENKEAYLSKQFKEEIALGDKFFGLMSLDTIYKTFTLFGYLLRTTEGFFANGEIKKQDQVIDILKTQGQSLSERLKKAASYVDTEMSPYDKVGFGCLQKDLFIVDKETIIPYLDQDILINIEKISQVIKNGGTTVKADADINVLGSIFFRNAGYGYCYKIAEEQLALANLK